MTLEPNRSMSQPTTGLVTELALGRAVCAHPNESAPNTEVVSHKA